MQDLQIDFQSNDILLEDGDLVLNSSHTGEELKQRLKIKLQFFLGEWFLNILYGIPYLQDILIVNPNFPTVSGIFRQAILEEQGVQELTLFEFDVLGANTLVLNFKANTDISEEQLVFNETIEIFRN